MLPKENRLCKHPPPLVQWVVRRGCAQGLCAGLCAGVVRRSGLLCRLHVFFLFNLLCPCDPLEGSKEGSAVHTQLINWEAMAGELKEFLAAYKVDELADKLLADDIDVLSSFGGVLRCLKVSAQKMFVLFAVPRARG